MLLALEPGYKMTNNLYCAKYEVVKRTASKELGELLAKGLLKKHGSTGQGTLYTRSRNVDKMSPIVSFVSPLIRVL
jgi:predicted HTH transcriptional regulator